MRIYLNFVFVGNFFETPYLNLESKFKHKSYEKEKIYQYGLFLIYTSI